MKRLLKRIVFLSVLAAGALVVFRLVSRRRSGPADPYTWAPSAPEPPAVHVEVHPPGAEPPESVVEGTVAEAAPVIATDPAPAAEVSTETTSAALPTDESLEAVVAAAEENEDGPVVPPPVETEAPVGEDFITNYFNKLADTPDEELVGRLAGIAEPGLDLAPVESRPSAQRPAYTPPPPPELPHTPIEATAQAGQIPSESVDLAALESPAETPPPGTPPAPAESPLQLPQSLEDALTEIAPMPIVAPPRRTAESYLDEGNVYFNVGQYKLAIERYTTAVEMDRELVAAYYNRANAHTRSGEFEAALADYDRALELQPFDADALNNRGMLHLYRANYPSALLDFNAALVIDPTDTTVIVNRGLAHLHSGDAADALRDFREAVAVDGEDAAAHYGASQASAVLGNTDDAIRSVARALHLNPGYAREAAADPNLAALQGDPAFLKLLRESGGG